MAMPPAVLETYKARESGSTVRWPTPGALAKHVNRATRQTGPLDLIDQVAVDILEGRVRKQQIYAPPQIGKSERVSHWMPLWLLLRDPSLRIAIVSAEQDLAVRWGRQIKRDVEESPDLGLRLRADSKAAGRWETAQGGGLYCVGIGGTLTGRPVDLLIIDDPIRDRQQAESKMYRNRVWDWWENVAKVRARATVLMNTRWHKDDLSGRLTEREAGQWAILSMPAIAEHDDPLGREPGEEIESANPELHYPGWFTETEKTTSGYVWNSLYQQHPTAVEGNIFKRGQWRYWEQFADEQGKPMLRLDEDRYALADSARFITIDLASSTKTSADWTVAAAWAITLDGDLVLLDRVRDRVPEIDHAEFIKPLRQRWLQRYDVTHIESRMFGTTLVYALGQKHVPIAELKADVNKLTRALPYAALVRQGRVWLPRSAPWLDEWIDEHADFKGIDGDTDDQVDVGAYGARVAITHWLPPEAPVVEGEIRPNADPEYVDLMTAAF